MIKLGELNIIYRNENTLLKSVQSMFPSVCPLDNGDILASHVSGEAFEAVNLTTNIVLSRDGGKSFSPVSQVYNKNCLPFPVSDSFKITHLGANRIAALGYAFDRKDPTLSISNPLTGGLLDSNIFFSLSDDSGKTWSTPRVIKSSFGPHVEASAPLTVLRDGSIAAPITNFPDWEGNLSEKMKGRLLRSYDNGNTWDDRIICMQFDENITCYEQRMCQLESDTLVIIGWNENAETGVRLQNHYTISYDNGKTFTPPRPTGIFAQASGVCAIGGERMLVTCAVRRDTTRPGIYGYIVNLVDDEWRIEETKLLWEPKLIPVKNSNLPEIFAFVKFGQPLATPVPGGGYLMSFWAAEEGLHTSYCLKVYTT